jgi:DNA-binding IclR family transcriptional regulator
VRRTGWATEEGEVTPGFASVAAAARDHTGRPVAGLAVTFEARPDTDADRDARERLARAALTAAAELTRRIGGRPV